MRSSGEQLDALEQVLHGLTELRATSKGGKPSMSAITRMGMLLRVLVGGVHHIPPLGARRAATEQNALIVTGSCLPNHGVREHQEQQLARVVVEQQVRGDRQSYRRPAPVPGPTRSFSR